MRFLTLFLIIVAAPVWSEGRAKIQADLNQNATPEIFELLVDESNMVSLRISEARAKTIEVSDFTWQGGLYGQEAELELTETGSVQVISQNEGCCRNRWRLALTLAYRDGGVRVAGITYSWRDTLDLEAYGVCDVNLLTGRGVIEQGDMPPQWFRVPRHAPLVNDWSTDSPLPEGCEVN